MNEEGIQYCRAARKPLLTPRHIDNRYKFAVDHKDWSVDKWKQVVFSDEKTWRFRPNEKSGVWRRRGDRYKAKYTVPTTQRSQGVMIWAAMRGDGKILVKLCPPKVKAKEYQAILKDSLDFIQTRCLSIQTIFFLKKTPLFLQVPCFFPETLLSARWGTPPPCSKYNQVPQGQQDHPV